MPKKRTSNVLELKKNTSKMAGILKKEPLSEFERFKHKRERKKKLRMLGGVSIITLLVMALVMAVRFVPGSRLLESLGAQFSSGSLYPIRLSGKTVRQMEALDWNAVVLDVAGLSVYDSKGIEQLSFSHGYTSPVLRTQGGRLLLYDQGGTRFEMATSSHALSGTSNSAIHAADIASNGTFALATSSSKSAAEVRIYNSMGEIIFTWPSSSPAISLALSPDGKQAAVCLLSTTGGALVTSVALLDLQDPKLLFKVDIPEELGCYVTFMQHGVALITDSSVKLLDHTDGKIRDTFDFNGQQALSFAQNGNSHLVLVLGSYRYMRGSEIVSLDSKVKELCRVSSDLSIENLYANTAGFSFMSDGVLHRYDHKGAMISQISVPGVIDYLPLGQDLYAVTNEEIRKLKLQ